MLTADTPGAESGAVRGPAGAATRRLLADRRERLAAGMAAGDLADLMITNPDLAWWLTGDRRCATVWVQRDGTVTADPDPDWIQHRRSPRLGLVGSATPTLVAALNRAAIAAVTDGRPVLAGARRAKDRFELEMLRRAAGATIAGFRSAAAFLDDTETRFAAELSLAFAEQGGGNAYDPSVASGTDAADVWSAPHRAVQMAGAPFTVIDAAAHMRGYKADLTVTVTRSAPASYRRKIDHLRAVERLVVDAIRAGVIECAELARRADDALTARGLSPLPHALGHGLGLELHEHPHLSRTSEHRLSGGDVFTIEPGFYDPQVGGARLESMYTVDDAGQPVRMTDAAAFSAELSHRTTEIQPGDAS
jgi:Xaa-Pro aminopeptidase